MPRTMIKSRLHSNKQKPKIKQEIKKINQIYLHIYNHLNKKYYQAMTSSNIDSYISNK